MNIKMDIRDGWSSISRKSCKLDHVIYGHLATELQRLRWSLADPKGDKVEKKDELQADILSISWELLVGAEDACQSDFVSPQLFPCGKIVWHLHTVQGSSAHVKVTFTFEQKKCLSSPFFFFFCFLLIFRNSYGHLFNLLKTEIVHSREKACIWKVRAAVT